MTTKDSTLYTSLSPTRGGLGPADLPSGSWWDADVRRAVDGLVRGGELAGQHALELIEERMHLWPVEFTRRMVQALANHEHRRIRVSLSESSALDDLAETEPSIVVAVLVRLLNDPHRSVWGAAIQHAVLYSVYAPELNEATWRRVRDAVQAASRRDLALIFRSAGFDALAGLTEYADRCAELLARAAADRSGATRARALESPAFSMLLRSEHPTAVRAWRTRLTDRVDAVAAAALEAADDGACLLDAWQRDAGATLGLLQSLFARRALHSALVLSGLLWSGPIALTADLVTRLAMSEDVAPVLRMIAADRVLEVLGSGTAPVALWRAVLQRPSPCALLPDGWPELLAEHLDVLVEAADHPVAHVAAQAMLQLSGQRARG